MFPTVVYFKPESFIPVSFGFIVSPIIAAASALELLGAEGVSDVFDGVAEAVSVVVGRIDAPLITGPVVGSVLDPVRDRVLSTMV
jgi:hypothetical protein